MRKSLSIFSIYLILFLHSTSLAYASEGATIIGFIEADLENEEEVLTIGIWDEEASKYTYISPGKGRGDELKRYIGWKATVVGIITTDEHGTEYLTVEKIRTGIAACRK